MSCGSDASASGTPHGDGLGFRKTPWFFYHEVQPEGYSISHDVPKLMMSLLCDIITFAHFVHAAEGFQGKAEAPHCQVRHAWQPRGEKLGKPKMWIQIKVGWEHSERFQGTERGRGDENMSQQVLAAPPFFPKHVLIFKTLLVYFSLIYSNK